MTPEENDLLCRVDLPRIRVYKEADGNPTVMKLPDHLRERFREAGNVQPSFRGQLPPLLRDERDQVGVAGLKGTYSGRAEVRDKRPPESLALVFDGKGAPGFVRGTATVRLARAGDGTRVTSNAEVQVGGLIAAVGSRLVDAAARKLAAEFFQQLAVEIGGAAESRART